MTDASSLGRHLVNVVAILVLGFVYVVALSFGTLANYGLRTVGSVRTAGSAVGRRITGSTRSG